ncbi:MAG: NUDIX hydrolase [Chloroflexota bacterium]|nr:NUDIX hydrolase [Chloroflexota bacterium]
MTKQIEPPQADVIEAAGGLLWRESESGRELAVVHRPHYDDWSLPKGKRDPGERWQDTALREVYEETNHKAELVSFAGSTAYVAMGSPKIVLFWNMTIVGKSNFRPNSEVDELIWLSVEDAVEKLSYETERALLETLI